MSPGQGSKPRLLNPETSALTMRPLCLPVYSWDSILSRVICPRGILICSHHAWNISQDWLTNLLRTKHHKLEQLMKNTFNLGYSPYCYLLNGVVKWETPKNQTRWILPMSMVTTNHITSLQIFNASFERLAILRTTQTYQVRKEVFFRTHKHQMFLA